MDEDASDQSKQPEADLLSGGSKAESREPKGDGGTAAGRPVAPWPWSRLAGTILLVTLACVRFPRDVMTPGPDDSWSSVLLNAHAKGWQFGRDIVFPYGPLGFLTIAPFAVQFVWLRMAFDLALCGVVATGVCLLARRLPVWWAVLVLGFFIFLPSNSGRIRADVLFETGIFCFGWLCLLESGPTLRLYAFGLVGLAVVASLVKFSLLLTSVLTLAVVAGDLALRGKVRLGMGVLAGFIFGFLLGWVLAGQEWPNLGAFLSNSFLIVEGYDKAMGRDLVSGKGGMLTAVLAVLTAVLSVRMVALPGSRRFGLRRVLVLVWLAGLIFLEWKHGYLRGDDDHIPLFHSFVPLLALVCGALPMVRPGRETKKKNGGDTPPLQEALPPERSMRWCQAAGLACCLVSAAVLEHSFPGFWIKHVKASFERVTATAGIMLQPVQFVKDGSEMAEQIKSTVQLTKLAPIIGQGTVDVFGLYQGIVFFNGLNYHPRPVFQSYSAYSRALMELNDLFYTSTKAPDYVLFGLLPADDRFPPTEDALLLRRLLMNYECLGEESRFLLLKRRRAETPRITLVQEGDVQAGEKIELGKYGETNLWMEIQVNPTRAGKLRQLVYKSSEVHLFTWPRAEDEPRTQFRAVPSMMEAGFLASPLAVTNGDVMAIYEGREVKRPGAYSVEFAPHAVSYWQEQVHYRIYRIENKLGPG